MYFSGYRGNMELTDALLKIDRKVRANILYHYLKSFLSL